MKRSMARAVFQAGSSPLPSMRTGPSVQRHSITAASREPALASKALPVRLHWGTARAAAVSRPARIRDAEETRSANGIESNPIKQIVCSANRVSLQARKSELKESGALLLLPQAFGQPGHDDFAMPDM